MAIAFIAFIAVALLIAMVAGVLFTLILGTARITQVRSGAPARPPASPVNANSINRASKGRA